MEILTVMLGIVVLVMFWTNRELRKESNWYKQKSVTLHRKIYRTRGDELSTIRLLDRERRGHTLGRAATLN